MIRVEVYGGEDNSKIITDVSMRKIKPLIVFFEVFFICLTLILVLDCVLDKTSTLEDYIFTGVFGVFLLAFAFGYKPLVKSLANKNQRKLLMYGFDNTHRVVTNIEFDNVNLSIESNGDGYTSKTIAPYNIFSSVAFYKGVLFFYSNANTIAFVVKEENIVEGTMQELVMFLQRYALNFRIYQ